MTRVYLAGPVSGHTDLNRSAFDTAATWVRASGWEPVVPLNTPVHHIGTCPDGHPLETGAQGTHPRPCWLRAGLQALLACDAIALLPGWQNSAGALLELQVAEACGMPVHHAPGN